MEKERAKALSDEERSLTRKKEELLKKHINILQGQLQLYDDEEKINMEASYDKNKTLRIAQLEILLREIENQLKTQAQELTKLINTSTNPVSAPNGPYEKITSGVKIIDFLNEIYQQKERSLQGKCNTNM